MREMVRQDATFALLAQVVPPILAGLTTPVLVNHLGLEAFGAIALATTATLLLASLEVGVSTSVGRSFAQAAAVADEPPLAMVHRLERRYLVVVTAIAVLGSIGAFILIDEGAAHAGAGLQEAAVAALAVLVGLRWPSPLYLTIMRARGLFRTAAVIIDSLAVLRYVGGAAAATATGDLRWVAGVMCVASAVELVVLRHAAVRGLTVGDQHDELDRRFALGVTFASVLASLLKQADKAIVATATSLALTGLYVFAANVVAAAALVAAGVYGLVVPAAAAALAVRDEKRLAAIAVQCGYLTLSIVSPFVLGLAVNAEFVLDFAFPASLAREGAAALVVLAVAGLINAATQVPLAIQHAAGTSRYGVATNLIGLFVCVPLAAVLASRFGVSGAACGWLVFNVGYACVVPFRSLSRLAGPEVLRSWAIVGVARPLAITTLLFVPAGIAALVGTDFHKRLALTAAAGGAALAVNWRRRPPSVQLGLAPSRVDPEPAR